MAKAKKPANQGSAGKANVQKPRTSGVPKPVTPAKSTLAKTMPTKGIGGSKKK